MSDYFDHPGLSASQIKTYLTCPITWYHRYVLCDWPFEDSDDMKLGREIHSMLELGGVDHLGFIDIPREVLNKDGHRKGKAYTDWAKQLPPDAIEIKPGETVPHRIIWDHVIANKECRQLLVQSEKEVELYNEDPDLGLTKSKIDLISPSWIIDWKTTTVPISKAAYMIADRHHDVQLAFYRRIVQQLRGVKLRCGVGLIQTTGGYGVAVRELSDDWLDNAEARMFEAVDEMFRFDIERYLAGDGIQLLKMPRSAEYDVTLT